MLAVLRHYGVSRFKSRDIEVELFDGPSPSSLVKALEESGITDDHPIGRKVIREATEFAKQRYPELEEESDDEFTYPDG